MNDKNLEQEEINLLLNKGFEIEVCVLGIKKTFKCKKMSLGRMLKLSNIFIKMEMDEELLTSGSFQEQIAMQYQAVSKNTKNVAKAMAVCFADNFLVRKFLEWYFLKNYTPNELLEFAQNLLKTANYANFITSIALMNGNRPTKANPIEKK